MRYAAVFMTLGGLLVWQAVRISPWIGWLVCWAGVSCLLVGAAYAGLGPRVFGKRPDGRLAWWSRLLLLPYLAAYQLLWHVVRITGHEPACHQVAKGVYLGRRPLLSDLPKGVARIVDLCVEFPALPALIAPLRYSALPALDAGLADIEAFRCLVDEVASDDGSVYIHCASGHGRGAMFAAALLIARGESATVEEAETMLRAARPGVKMSSRQRAFVQRATTKQVIPFPA